MKSPMRIFSEYMYKRNMNKKLHCELVSDITNSYKLLGICNIINATPPEFKNEQLQMIKPYYDIRLLTNDPMVHLSDIVSNIIEDYDPEIFGMLSMDHHKFFFIMARMLKEDGYNIAAYKGPLYI